MNIDPKDPRLTAYALGEFEDEQEGEEIEKALERSQALRRKVEEIRQTAAWVTTELGREPSPGLSPKHQKRIEAELPASSPLAALSVRMKWGMAGGLAAAACVIFAIVISIPNLFQSRGGAQILAELTSPSAGAPAAEVAAVQKALGNERSVPAEPQSQVAKESRQTAGPVGSDNESFKKREGEKKNGLASTFAELKDSLPQHPKTAFVERDKAMVGGSLGKAGQVTRGAGEPMNQRPEDPENQPTAVSKALTLSTPDRAPRSRSEANSMALSDSRPVDIASPAFNREGYDRIRDNPFVSVAENPLSTFSIDVDTASYSNLRRFLNSGTLPPKNAVRIEEMINYFSYDYPDPEGEQPFSVHTEVAQAPWQPEHRLLRVGLKGKELAKDVKIQIEFNPLQVAAYRLVGDENRLLSKEDLNDDTKDAGEIGAGHTVTALYEIVPAGQAAGLGSVDALKYQGRLRPTEQATTGELLTLKLRYQNPEATRSALFESVVRDSGREYARASQDFKFAAAVASFGMLLRESPYRGTTTLESVLELAQAGKGADAHGYRSEFLELVRKARSLIGADPPRQ